MTFVILIPLNLKTIWLNNIQLIIMMEVQLGWLWFECLNYDSKDIALVSLSVVIIKFCSYSERMKAHCSLLEMIVVYEIVFYRYYVSQCVPFRNHNFYSNLTVSHCTRSRDIILSHIFFIGTITRAFNWAVNQQLCKQYIDL